MACCVLLQDLHLQLVSWFGWAAAALKILMNFPQERPFLSYETSCNLYFHWCYMNDINDPAQPHPCKPYHPKSAATKNQLQQRREFTADLDTKPGEKPLME